MEEVPRRTSLVPLAFPCFVLRLIGVETEGLLDYQGRAGDHFQGDHFHCTVEPSSGHIRCRILWRGNMLHFPGLQPREIWKFRSCSGSVSGVFPDCVPDFAPEMLSRTRGTSSVGGQDAWEYHEPGTPHESGPLAFPHLFMSEKPQNGSSPNFSNFRPEVCAQFCSEFSPNFLRSSRASSRGKRRPETNSPKIPGIFQCKIPRQTRTKKILKCFLGGGQSNTCGTPNLRNVNFMLVLKGIFGGSLKITLESKNNPQGKK